MSLTQLALAGTGLLAGLLAAEVAYRVIRPPSTGIDHQPAIYQPDPVLGWRYIPLSSDYIERYEFRLPVQMNGDGFFDDEFSETPQVGVTRIAILGDSFTVGYQSGRGHNFPDLLEHQLNQAGVMGCPCEVLNFGIDGTDTIDQSHLLQNIVLAYEPDVVIVAFFRNDVQDARQGEMLYREMYRDFVFTYRDPADREAVISKIDTLLDSGGTLLRFGVQNSYIVRALYNTWLEHQPNLPEPNLRSNFIRATDLQQLTRPSLSIPLEQAYLLLEDSIDTMANACRRADCTLAFVVIPGKTELLGAASALDGPVVEALAERGIPSLELRQTFAEHLAYGEMLYWEHDSHTTDAGNFLIASELADFLQRERLLPQQSGG